ncbi:MAG TPA: hypothetical protein VFU49_21630 [Ktedonobacteraceae bacterium]|nr:hypothetical protein [Ktedonobacteraceae bacterium]
MPTWIVYGLVIIFFLALPLVIFFFVEEPTSAKSAQQFVQHSDCSKQTAVISYGILAAIFAFILVLTVFSHKSQKAATP